MSLWGLIDDLPYAFSQWLKLGDKRTELEEKFERNLPPEGDERVAVLRTWIEEAGGRNTELGHAIDVYLVRQEVIARRLATRAKGVPMDETPEAYREAGRQAAWEGAHRGAYRETCWWAEGPLREAWLEGWKEMKERIKDWRCNKCGAPSHPFFTVNKCDGVLQPPAEEEKKDG